MKKTTKEDFRQFKDEFMWAVELLGLSEWKIIFKHVKLSSAAQIEHRTDTRVAIVSLTTSVDNDEDIVFCAYHEAAHLLTADLYDMGRLTFNQGYVGAYDEAIANRVGHALSLLKWGDL